MEPLSILPPVLQSLMVKVRLSLTLISVVLFAVLLSVSTGGAGVKVGEGQKFLKVTVDCAPGTLTGK